MTSKGRSLKIYLADGTPSGIITAEMGLSSAKTIAGSRTSLPALLMRPEVKRTGVYLLQGTSETDNQETLVYVGEGDFVSTRLASHDNDPTKTFFDRISLVISKDENLTKAHGRYLESRLIDLIKKAGNARVTNATSPKFDGLPEADLADMERMLEEITSVLPLVGFDLFKPTISQDGWGQNHIANGLIGDNPNQEIKHVQFIANVKDAKAEAIEEKGLFIVLSGSTVVKEVKGSLYHKILKKRQHLAENGLLQAGSKSSVLQLLEDATFNSPSAASQFVAGRSDNGRTTWKVKVTGQTYADWREQKLQQS